MTQEDIYMIARAVSKTELVDKLYDVVCMELDTTDSKYIVFLADKRYSVAEMDEITIKFKASLEHCGIFLRYKYGGALEFITERNSYDVHRLNIPSLIREIKINQMFDYEI